MTRAKSTDRVILTAKGRAVRRAARTARIRAAIKLCDEMAEIINGLCSRAGILPLPRRSSVGRGGAR